METVDGKENGDITPFNSPLEVGTRSVIILSETYPRSYDLTQLTWLDHFIVHSADIGGPPSIHPDIPQRSGELLVRRKLVENGLIMMQRLHMVEQLVVDQGLYYKAGNEAEPFVELMISKYSCLLKERAKWLSRDVGDLTYEEMKNLTLQKLGKWNVEFTDILETSDHYDI